ncbi:hypothetical protein [Cypionkella sinensis]|uniref:Uncharacterized protein n=1 Tax=Cypionkella sinensis TaxID=1756043 RepID=A0ABV7J191_9RHOB
MSMLTRLVLLLAVLALLPFGSFAAKFGTVPHVAAAVVSAQLDDDAAVAPVAAQKTFATVQSRCKGTALPGSPCNPALAVWPDELTLAFHAPATLLQAGAWWARPGQTPAQPRDPPKLA